MVHQGANFGDVYALNSYLNMIPLQEREEWISEWSKTGEMPYMAVEFGTPLHATMMRNRQGFKQVIVSEPWMTEFAAIYFGKQAYELETAAYKSTNSRAICQGSGVSKLAFKKRVRFCTSFSKVAAVIQYKYLAELADFWNVWGDDSLE